MRVCTLRLMEGSLTVSRSVKRSPTHLCRRFGSGRVAGRNAASRAAASSPERRINHAFTQNCFWREFFFPFRFTSHCGIRDLLRRGKHDEGGPPLPATATETPCVRAPAPPPAALPHLLNYTNDLLELIFQSGRKFLGEPLMRAPSCREMPLEAAKVNRRRRMAVVNHSFCGGTMCRQIQYVNAAVNYACFRARRCIKGMTLSGVSARWRRRRWRRQRCFTAVNAHRRSLAAAH